MLNVTHAHEILYSVNRERVNVRNLLAGRPPRDVVFHLVLALVTVVLRLRANVQARTCHRVWHWENARPSASCNQQQVHLSASYALYHVM